MINCTICITWWLQLLSKYKDIVALFVLHIWLLCLKFVTKINCLYGCLYWPSIQIVWESYKLELDSLPTYCTAGRRIWTSVVVGGRGASSIIRNVSSISTGWAIVTKWCGYFRSTSQDSLQGKFEKDYWAVEHNVHIKQWTGWGQRVLDALISNSDMTYDDAYMQWYRKITRRFIMREFAY